MKKVTTTCSRFRHPEFMLEADEAVVPDVYLQNLAQTVGDMVAGGSVFRPGQTFQIGWMLTQVKEHGSGFLSLSEPDMQTFPIKWVSGVTETLRQKMLQLFMLDSVSLRSEITMASIRQSLTICSRYTEKDFFMYRLEPLNERDSGWFLGCLEKKHDHRNRSNIGCVSVYDAFLHQRGIQHFALFPVGSMIIFDEKEGMRILKEGKDLPIAPGSFLEVMMRKKSGGDGE